MKSKAQIANHPLHPMLIVVPAGAFVLTLIFDVVYIAAGATYVGFWLTLAGAALLAVSGWLGWKMVYEYHVAVLEHPEAKDPDPRAEPGRQAAD